MNSLTADLERVVLGACLLENSGDIELALSILRPQHFELDSHQRIFRHIGKLQSTQQPINFLTVAQALGAAQEIEAIGGTAYVASLTEGLPRFFGESLRNYAERVKEFWRLRQLAALGELMASSASGETSTDIIGSVTARLETIADDCSTEDPTIGGSIVGFMDRLYTRRNLKESPGLSYGLAELDRQTDGMMPGEQTAVGAVSGVGKTAFMGQAIWATLSAGHAVDAFLIEPTKDQIMARLISLMTGVRYEALIKPWKMRRDEEELMRTAASQFAEMPLRMFARSTLTLDELLGHARIGMRKHGTRLICTDYIQRLKIRQAEKDESVRLRVARASTALADLVKNTQTHSLLLSQIGTGRKGGPAAIPTMFDFRETSQIENDAHVIILLHREFDEQQGHYNNKGAIFVPKQRNGVPCNLKAWFDPATAAWTDHEPSAPRASHDRQESYV